MNRPVNLVQIFEKQKFCTKTIRLVRALSQRFSLPQQRGKIGYGKMRNSLIIPTCIMKPKDFLRSVILIVALSAFGISSGVASDKIEAKHSSKITKARAERIALTKMRGGSIRSAELETARGRRFWSVYIAKPGSKNAKEIRVDATSGQILAVQTERPEDQAEEPPKTH